MKIGIITDIHSNIDALKAVFKEFKEKNIDKVICLGDIIGIGPYSHECTKFLIEKKDMMISWILGNHERYLIDGIPKTHHSIPNGTKTRKIEYACYEWNHSQLTIEENEFLKSRPIEDTLYIEGLKIVIEHYPYNASHEFAGYYNSPSFDEVRNLFRCKDANIYIYGHTHERCINEKNNVIYINPGSVGCPLNTNKALYGVLDINNGKYEYRSYEAEYDIKKVIKDIENLGYPMYGFMVWRFYDKTYEYDDSKY